jgi:hypothetical protein
MAGFTAAWNKAGLGISPWSGFFVELVSGPFATTTRPRDGHESDGLDNPLHRTI